MEIISSAPPNPNFDPVVKQITINLRQSDIDKFRNGCCESEYNGDYSWLGNVKVYSKIRDITFTCDEHIAELIHRVLVEVTTSSR